jgi:hypothetical protein
MRKKAGEIFESHFSCYIFSRTKTHITKEKIVSDAK